MLMKLAHRQVEMQQKRNLVQEEKKEVASDEYINSSSAAQDG
jgi:hypothetical protein